jgi:hypothetical protein
LIVYNKAGNVISHSNLFPYHGYNHTEAHVDPLNINIKIDGSNTAITYINNDLLLSNINDDVIPYSGPAIMAVA